MPERLSPLDASFLRVETPSAHMHVGWKGIFGEREADAGGPISINELRAHILARLRHAPRFRQRLAFPPGGLGEPVWVDDERFDIAWHVRAASPPGEAVSAERFDRLADRVLSTPLERRRALWEIHLVPRLEGGGSGLVMKVHHAMVDGKSAVELVLLLLDLSSEPTVHEPDGWEPARAPGGARLALDAVADSGRERLRDAVGLARTALSPGRGSRLADTLRRTALAVGEDVLRPAPPSPWNVPIGPERVLMTQRVPIFDVLEVKRRHGVTVNDVCLAVVAGALRAAALGQGAEPLPLKVMVPVSVRSPEEAATLGNRISFVFVRLPLDEADPVARLAEIHEATRAFKESGRAAGGEVVLGAIGYLPGPLKDRAARLAASRRMYNLTVSNVPGPRVPVYLLGAELEEAYPVIPLADDHALAVGVFTYRDRVCFGCYADPEALPDAGGLPSALLDGLRELAAAGLEPAHHPRAATPAEVSPPPVRPAAWLPGTPRARSRAGARTRRDSELPRRAAS
jgi:diacylglycerol O-acyltransferase